MRRPAKTSRRVADNTPDRINARIRKQMHRNIAALAGDPAAIQRRLDELDREWDIERCLATGSATLTLTGLALSVTADRRWLLLSGAVQGFFMQHAIQGWCPPLPVFRALGVRTTREIEAERHALKALLGQYERVGAGRRPRNGTLTAHRTLETALR